MAFHQRAKITVELDRLGYVKSKYFIGTENEVLIEAQDWMHSVALQFIEENDIDDPFEQDLIFEGAIHTIEWEAEDPISMFAVIEADAEYPVYSVYPTRADAEEAIFEECYTWAYEAMMKEDPEDFLGYHEWDYISDFKWLTRDCARIFSIQEIPVYGAEVRE